MPDLECVVVDDGGEQDLSWVDDLDPRVRRHRQSNGGVSVSRNEALLHTTAPLVAYLDQDDEWLPHKLHRQVEELGDADLSYTAFVWVHPDGREQPNSAPLIDYRQFLREGHLCLSSLLVKRTALVRVGGFQQMLRVQQDYDLVLRLLAARAKPHALSDSLARCHLHGDNVSADYRRALWERLHVLHLHAKEALDRGDETTIEAARVGMRVSRTLYASQAFTSFRSDRSPRHLLRAVGWSPVRTSSALLGAAFRKRAGL